MGPFTEHVLLAVGLECLEGVHVHVVGRSVQDGVAGLRAVGRVEACGRQSGSGRAIAVRVEHHVLLQHDGGLLVHGTRRGGRSEHGVRDVLGLLLLVDGCAALRVQNVR